jgi:lysophospholipid acyltransferase (LPLAT)-like uncharacterized protein
MKLRSPWLIRPLALLGSLLIRAWLGTVRRRADTRACGPHPTDPRRQRCIYAFWHESLLTASTFPTRCHVLISQHADGELIARVCGHLGIGTVRGSTTRGGVEALLDLVRVSRRSHLAVTPDGPRGPRRRVQPGVIFLAAHTGLPVVAFGVGYSRAWRAPSWDRFAVPLPGSTAYAVGATPLQVPAGINRADLEHYRRLLEQRLLAATAAAERWAETGVRPPPLTTLDEPPTLGACA